MLLGLSMTKTAGIYMIQNTVTGDDYIGSSVDISKRWIKHRYLLRLQKHFNLFLQNSWNKYGLTAFKFFVLEITSNLRDRELYWINQCSPTLNGTIVIDRPDPDGLGFCITESTRKKLSDAHKGHIPANKGLPGRKHTDEEKQHLSDINKGRVFSSEWRQKISTGKIGKHRKPATTETRQKLSIAMMGNTHAKGKGHPQSTETRNKISQTRIRLFSKRNNANVISINE
jgi:group I intron endonuclease